jgi:flagellar protein FliO/FliZ
MATSAWLSSLLWFLGIVAAIPLALWLLKRTPVGRTALHGMTRVVAVLPLSTSQRVITVEVGQGEARRWLVLGVTAGSITTLHSMEPQAEAPASAAPAVPGFAQMLARLKNPQGTPDGR